MSLLDDVSIVVTPNGYKAGELYAVIPVPTEGAEEVTNGDFATDTDWTKGTGITISGGSANFTGNSNANISQNTGLVVGTRYRATFTIINYVSGDIDINVGGDTRQGSYAANGNYTVDIVCFGGNNLYFQEDSAGGGVGFTGSISNVSVKEYTSADMDVTRATAATRVDENGLVNYAEVIGGEEVTNGDYTEAGVGNVISQSGGILVNDSNRLKITSDGSSGFSRGVWDTNSSQGERFIIKADVISITGGVRFIDISNNAGASLVSGTTFEIEIILGSAAKQVGFGGFSDTSFELILDNVSVKEVTRDNVPRIDYTGGGCPHILAEPQRTNLLTYSEDFSQTGWQKIRSSVTSGFSSPDGGNNSYRWQEDTNSGVHSLKDPYSFNSVDYSQSIFIKPNGRSNVSLWVDGASKGTRFDLSSGTIYSETSSVGKITAMNDGWFKISTTVLGTSGTAFNLYALDNFGNISYTGDGTSGFYVYGAQLEEGSYPTSYIPTSGSTVTRNQDIFTRDGIGSLINSTEGTFFAEIASLSDDGTNRGLSLSDGTNSNRILIYYTPTSNQIVSLYTYGGSTQVAITHTLSDSTEFIKCAFKFKENDCAFWINGIEVGADTSTTAFSANTLNDLSFDTGAGANPFYGKVKQLQVYDTALTDTQLAALTS